MAIFDQSGQHVGIQTTADVLVTDDLSAMQRWLDMMITGLQAGRQSERRLMILRQLKSVYVEVSNAVDAGE